LDLFTPAVPLGIIVLGRDVFLSLSAFWIRWKTLPSPVSDNLDPSRAAPWS
jgi:hypothetical protein